MSIDDLVAEAEALARDLGGGWRIEHGVMVMVVLTIDEARRAASRLREINDADERLRELAMIEGCIVEPSERRLGRTYERVQEMLGEIRALMAAERLDAAPDEA
jgi:hypothetical protein